MTSGSNLPTGRKPKRLSAKEKEYANLMLASGLGCIEAARKVFGWRCEPGSIEARKAVELKRAPRVREYMREMEAQAVREFEANKLIRSDSDTINWDKIRKFAFDRLAEIRDNQNIKSQTRFNAIKALEKLSDPSGDVNLIFKWLDVLWRGATAHCPRCHNSFSLWKIKNQKLEEWRQKNELPSTVETDDLLEKRMEILSRAELRKRPHPGQIKALAAPERSIAASGAARGGKSFLLGMLALLSFLIPGVEVWVLARIYDDARSEVDYLKKFLNTLFFPHYKDMIRENFDSKTGELTLMSNWGSELRIRSAKAKGSITGRELEMALVAEPGWVPEELYEELRSRMSSRLGRIVMLGTPKGYGGILGRMLNLTGRDPETRKIIRMSPEQRTLAAGCNWNVSLCAFTMDPKDNPEYVKSELKAARMELMDEEYASEFEGLMSSAQGAKFPHVKPQNLIKIPRGIFDNCVFVLGVDQGPKNFAATLLGWDGKTAYVAREYFENDMQTMKSHMEILRKQVPLWIRYAGGNPDDWKLTIFDADPPLINELEEFNNEGKTWPTEVTWRPKNATGRWDINWRQETYEFVNQLTALEQPALYFDAEFCDLLHDQMMRAQDRPITRDKDSSGQGNTKGWVIHDPWRGDHVVDSLILALYTVLSNQIIKMAEPAKAKSSWDEHQAAFDFTRMRDEQRELKGFIKYKNTEDELYEKQFGRKRVSTVLGGIRGYYENES